MSAERQPLRDIPAKMDDEIDLREYVLVLLRHWRLIAALTIVAAVISGAISFTTPPAYQATALITTTMAGLSNLALSDAVIAKTIAGVDQPLPAEMAAPDALRAHLAITQPENSTLVTLAVNDRDPSRAAAIANAWAAAVIEVVQKLPAEDATGTFDPEALQSALDEATVKRNQAEQALTDFRTADQSVVWRAELQSKQQALAGALSSLNQLKVAAADAEAMRARLGRLDPDGTLPLAEYLSLIDLAQRGVLSGQANVQFLQVPLTEVSNLTIAQQLAYVDELITSFHSRSAEIDARIGDLSADIFALQTKIAGAQGTEDSLVRERDLTAGIHATQSAKVEISRVAASSGAKLASAAAVPTQRVSPKRTQTVVLAAAVGLMLGVLAAFGIEWWRAPGPAAQDKRGDATETHKPI